MKVVATIPVKHTSVRVPGKNFRPFAGQPLFRHFFDKLLGSPFDEIVVDTDDEQVEAGAREMGWTVLRRPPELSAPDANGNHLLLWAASQVPADVYFQLFVTAPLLTPQTIVQAYERLMQAGEHDSLFTAVAMHGFFWYQGQAINYRPRDLPQSQRLTPMVRETTGLYGITAQALHAEQCRIGRNPYVLLVDDFEAVDIDTEQDLSIATLFYDHMTARNDART